MPQWAAIRALEAEVPVLSSQNLSFLRRPAVVMVCGALILTLAMGVRHTGLGHYYVGTAGFTE